MNQHTTITQLLLAALTCSLFFHACTKKEESGPAFVLLDQNKNVQTRKDKCLAEKAGNVWEKERCYNPKDAAIEKANCSYPNTWKEDIKTCETDLLATQRKCFATSTTTVFRNGECYNSNDEMPEKCDDIEKFWNGALCEPRATAKNFYRICIAKTKKTSEKESMEKLREAVGSDKNCTLAYKALLELKEINISTTSFSTTLEDSVLLRLDKLETLQLSGYNLNTTSSSAINSLKALVRLSIVKSNIRSTDFLSNLENLTQLVLSENPLSQINSLTNAKKLASLDLSKTQVTSLIPLRDLENLTELKVAETPFESFMFRHLLTESHCPFKDVKSQPVQILCKELIDILNAPPPPPPPVTTEVPLPEPTPPAEPEPEPVVPTTPPAEPTAPTENP